MIVDIHGQGFTVTPALAEHMRRRLGIVLTRHSDRIQRVAIRVGDENGPRGGVDKYELVRRAQPRSGAFPPRTAQTQAPMVP